MKVDYYFHLKDQLCSVADLLILSVLTSRKYGVATIWLVATLGSKSSQRKVTRRDILKVNVPKACETLREPEAPMALRLQSNLLYGISSVYSQQCGYVLADAQNVQTQIRQMLKAARIVGLDVEEVRTRPDQLLLRDDPTFLPDLAFGAFNFDLSNLELTTDPSSQQSSFFSPHTSRSSQSSNIPLPELVIPSSSPGLGVGIIDESVKRRSEVGQSALEKLAEEDDGFLPDADFSIDAEGNLTELGAGGALTERPASFGRRRAGSGDNSALEYQVRKDHEDARRRQIGEKADRNEDLNYSLPPAYDPLNMFPNAEPFAPRGTGYQTPNNEEQDTGEALLEVTEAPLGRTRKITKPLEADEVTELRTADLRRFRDNYLSNMSAAVHAKMQHRAPHVAKKMVIFWTIGSGIGGIGASIGNLDVSTPLEIFYGDKIIETITGRKPRITLKRSREVAKSSEEGDHERRVRPRGSSAEEIGRGEDGLDSQDGGLGPLLEEEMFEIGRDAPNPLAGDLSHDLSSTMPWNIHAQRSSSISRQGSLHFGSLSSTPLRRAQYLSRRSSRLISASPLFNYGRGTQALAVHQHSNQDLPLIPFPGEGASDDTNSPLLDEQDDFPRLQVHGTQEDAVSRAPWPTWLRETLDGESNSFLNFMEDLISKRKKGPSGEEFEDIEALLEPSITFSELLPPTQTRTIAAAQGLLYMLTLATKGLIWVAQDEPFGDMRMGPTIVEETPLEV